MARPVIASAAKQSIFSKESSSFFEKKEPKKLLLLKSRELATSPALESQKFFAELFFKKATSFLK